MTHKYRSDHAPHNQPDPQTERESQLSVVSLDRPSPPSRHYYTRSLLKMFAVANTTALTVRAKAPVKARRATVARASLVTDAKKAASKAAKVALTASTALLPAAAYGAASDCEFRREAGWTDFDEEFEDDHTYMWLGLSRDDGCADLHCDAATGALWLAVHSRFGVVEREIL